jgi:hypothetical protein
MVMSSLPFELVKGWYSSPFRCGDGVIVLFPQDGPPHQKPARAMLAGPRPTDRYKDRLTVSRFASQVENQPNLTVFPYTTEVVDPAPIRLLSSSLPIRRARPLLRASVTAAQNVPLGRDETTSEPPLVFVLYDEMRSTLVMVVPPRTVTRTFSLIGRSLALADILDPDEVSLDRANC